MLIFEAPDRGNKPLRALSPDRRVSEFKFGPFSFSELRRRTLTALGCTFTDQLTGVEVLNLAADAWLAADAVAAIRSDDGEVVYCDENGSPVAFRAAEDAPNASGEHRTLAPACRVRQPWHLLQVVKVAAADLSPAILPTGGTFHDGPNVDGVLWTGAGTQVLPGVYVEGTVVIGRNCKIGPNCYLRGPIFIGDNCRIGQAVEIKASLIMDNSAVGHLSYLGDSVLGSHVNFGAGTITANLRHDGANVRAMVGNELADTDRRKLGAIVGDGVHTGIHTSIYPGRQLAAGASTRPGEVVDRDRNAPES